MPKRKHYPPQIDRKYEDLPEDASEQNTDTKLDAAELVEEHWNQMEDATFKAISELDGAPSPKTIRRAWEDYFGPTDDDRTFTELIKEYGSTDAYFEAKKNGETDGAGPTPANVDVSVESGLLSDREERIARLYYELGFEDGMNYTETE